MARFHPARQRLMGLVRLTGLAVRYPITRLAHTRTSQHTMGHNGPRVAASSGAAASAEALDDGGVGLAAALAHRLQPVTATAALELVQHLGHQDRAGGAERVPERDRAAVRVGL